MKHSVRQIFAIFMALAMLLSMFALSEEQSAEPQTEVIEQETLETYEEPEPEDEIEVQLPDIDMPAETDIDVPVETDETPEEQLPPVYALLNELGLTIEALAEQTGFTVEALKAMKESEVSELYLSIVNGENSEESEQEQPCPDGKTDAEQPSDTPQKTDGVAEAETEEPGLLELLLSETSDSYAGEVEQPLSDAVDDAVLTSDTPQEIPTEEEDPEEEAGILEALLSGTSSSSVKLTGVTLDRSGTVTLNLGSTLKLRPSPLPSTAIADSYSWKSSSTKYATVSTSGVVTPVKEGTTTITVTAKRGSTKKTASVKVKVVDPTKPTSVALDKTGTVTLNLGSTLKLKSTLQPSTAIADSCSWKSSSTKYATVSTSGVVTPVKEGTTTITVTVKRGSVKKSASVKVKVVDPTKPTSVALDRTGTVTLNLGSTLKLKPSLQPSTAIADSYSWKSSETKYATVSTSGVVTPVKEGTTTITVTVKRGSVTKTASVKVKVIKSPDPVPTPSPKTVVVTFNANGGSCGTSSKTINSGASIGALPTATRTGYTFSGWYSSSTGGTQATISTTFSVNTTLYAHWSSGPVAEFLTKPSVSGGSVGGDKYTISCRTSTSVSYIVVCYYSGSSVVQKADKFYASSYGTKSSTGISWSIPYVFESTGNSDTRTVLLRCYDSKGNYSQAESGSFTCKSPSVALSATTSTSISNTSDIQVWFNATVKNATKATLKVLNSSGTAISFRTAHHVNNGLSAVKSYDYPIGSKSGTTLAIGVHFPAGTAAGNYTISMTASNGSFTSSAKTIGVTINQKYVTPSTFSTRRYPSKLLWPLGTKYKSVSSPVGERKSPTNGASTYHHGTDIPAPTGTPIMAAAGGKAYKRKNTWSGYGNGVLIDHQNGFYTFYAHMSSYADIFSSNNTATVSAGQIIGYVGETGTTTGPCLHFELSYCWYGGGNAGDYGYTFNTANAHWGTNKWEIISGSPSVQSYTYK